MENCSRSTSRTRDLYSEFGSLKFTILPHSSLQQPLSSVQFSCSVVSNSLRPHELQHTRLPCPSPTLRACSNACPLSQWCHPTISSSVFPLSSCLQSFPASGSFQMSQFFTLGGQIIGVSASASILSMNIGYVDIKLCFLKFQVSVQSLSHVWLFANPRTTACQGSLFFSVSQNWLKRMSIESVMPSNYLILHCPLLLLPSIFPSFKSFPLSPFFALGGQILKFQLQHQSFQWIFRTDFL